MPKRLFQTNGVLAFTLLVDFAKRQKRRFSSDDAKAVKMELRDLDRDVFALGFVQCRSMAFSNLPRRGYRRRTADRRRAVCHIRDSGISRTRTTSEAKCLARVTGFRGFS